MRELAARYYAHELSRLSIDPMVLVKLMMRERWWGVRSGVELLHQAGMRLDVRRFLGCGLSERLAEDQTL